MSVADIPDNKLTEYLLSETHPAGRAKAAFFLTLGFGRAESGQLALALRAHALNGRLGTRVVTQFGTKYTVEGSLDGNNGREAMVRSVWFREAGQTRVKFVTAYPLPGHAS
jgi:hypothetical protein